MAAPPVRHEQVSQVYNLEVTQFADAEVNIGPAPETYEAGKTFSIPIEIANTGNGSDSFNLESGFPADYALHFAAATTPDIPVTTTPVLAAGQKFRAVAVGTTPRSNIDGQRNRYPVRVFSAFAREASQSREIVLVSSAPLLRTVIKSEKPKLMPGENVSYRISLKNIGTAAARGVSVRVYHPPQYEPLAIPPGFKQEAKGGVTLDNLQLRPGDSEDYELTFQLKDEAVAEQELFLRVEVNNTDLQKSETLVSATSVVQRVSGVTAKIASDKVVVIPGQVVSVPLKVTNTGNIREVFGIKARVPDGTTYAFFEDFNRDGKKQPNEPVINHIRPLAPKEDSYVVLQIATPASASDRAVAFASVFFEPESVSETPAAVKLQLSYSRPLLELAMNAQAGRLRPGDVSSLELNCVNRGSGLAKEVTVQSVLPPQLELIAAEPSFARSDNGLFTWRFDEFGAGEKRNIKVTYRVKPGIAVGTNMQLKNLLSYQDQLGNRY